MQYRGKKNFEEGQLRKIVSSSNTKREILVALDLPTGGTYGYKVLNYFIYIYDIDTSHLMNRIQKLQHMARMREIPLHEILSGKHPSFGTTGLRMKLIKEGVFEHICSSCKLSEWMGLPISLDLDHINGKNWDHRLENIRLLCRNCHALTDTFCGKNTMKAKKTSDKKISHIPSTQAQDTIDENIKAILSSGIDFSKSGWVSELSVELDMRHQHIRRWLRKHMPDFEKKCFKRK